MMKTSSDLANKGIERILELSADAHIRRRGTIKSSPEYQNLTGAIAAYGRTLALLTGLQQWEEFRGNELREHSAREPWKKRTPRPIARPE